MRIEGATFNIDTAAQYIATLRRCGYSVGVTSGGFDPIHSGHTSCIMEAANLCDFLFVVVNGNEFIRRKKNVKEPFQPIEVRLNIAAAVKGVTGAIPFDASDPSDLTVNEALEILKPNTFYKGGDRSDISKLPEAEVCKKLGIQIITNVGSSKLWSSSIFLKAWDERSKEK